MSQLTIDTTNPFRSATTASHFIWAGRSLVECKVARELDRGHDTDTSAELVVHTTEEAIREALVSAAIISLRVNAPSHQREYDAPTRHTDWMRAVPYSPDLKELTRFGAAAGVTMELIVSVAVNREQATHTANRTAWLEREARKAANKPKPLAEMADEELWEALTEAERGKSDKTLLMRVRVEWLNRYADILGEADARGYSYTQLKKRVAEAKGEA